jgi:serine/threonine protein phosphatase 1
MIDTVLAPGWLPDGERVYAIGDVHGCAGQLVEMHRLIIRDLAARPTVAPTVLHLGDYIDRGPDSAGVLTALLECGLRARARLVLLGGNHEAMLLAAVRGSDRSAAEMWLDNGGEASLESWGIAHDVAQREWAECIPRAHLDLVRSLSLTYRQGGYLFVHAGVRPGVPIERQTTDDLLWIREPFLSSQADFGSVVVHGHTPRPRPELRPNRICVDTGAVFGGPLTAAVLELDQVGFIQV